MLITNRTNTRFGKYDGFSTNLLIGELNSGSKEISIQITDVDPGRGTGIDSDPAVLGQHHQRIAAPEQN